MTSAHDPGRIGPNAVIRVAEALRQVEGQPMLERVFHDAALAEYLSHPPTDMVDEREVATLHRVLRTTLGDDRARAIGWDAGQRTGDYLLRYRIPRPARAVLGCLPAGAASRLLVSAIARNAWTFAGTGRFSVRRGRPVIVSIDGCPLCQGAVSDRPYCDFYAATFQRLFARLVRSETVVTEIGCQATGDAACAFSVAW